MGSDMHSVPKVSICYPVLWQVLQAHLCITGSEFMDHNSNYKKNKCSHLPLLVFGHADTFGCMCHVFFDISASETRHYLNTIESHSETGTFAIMFQK